MSHPRRGLASLSRTARFKLTGWAGSMRLAMDHPLNRGHRFRALARFAGWQLWRLTLRRPLTTRFWNGLKLRAYPNSPISGAAICTGLPDFDEMLFVTRFLRAGETFIDVGANVGMYSLLAASVLGDGTVVAIEPDPVAAARLEENARLNGFPRIAVRIAAAGASNGWANLTADLDVMNHIVDGVDEPATVSRRRRCVPMTTLDDQARPFTRLSLIKIDAEGFESHVLTGAQQVLSRHPSPVWIVEVNGFGSRYGEDDAAITRIFARHGYRAFAYDALANRILPVPPGRGANVIFSRGRAYLERRLEGAAIGHG